MIRSISASPDSVDSHIDGVPVRLRLAVRGAVQGVGFRPFVYRLAVELGLAGWVNNSAQGVFIEVEGGRSPVEQFLLRFPGEKPPRSFIQSLESSWLDPAGYQGFEIRDSEPGGAKTALVLPDIATCPDCLREVLDPANRRHLYPFTNCTNCGPRFTIIEALPYDRANTSMKHFRMCPRCQAEYDDPLDRRFHAQPNACPECGPRLELWDRSGRAIHTGHAALTEAVAALRAGAILAVKGLGGFQLMVPANSDAGVRRLRELKRREEKPFALMFPTLAAVKTCCAVNEFEERLLGSPEAPIVLLRRIPEPAAAPNPSLDISPSVAPGNPNLGVMLPYTPLHHLLLRELGVPVVATSGNISDEPICIDEREALARLGGLADLFLVHNRPIVRHADDSIARVMLGRELVLRRARGYAPLPVLLRQPVPATLAVGAHLKNSIALSVDQQVFVSQHIGDLETEPALEAFQRAIGDFERLFETAPARVAADLHPDYLSTRFAEESRLPVVRVQHHYAHVLSCMAENDLDPPVLGISWDGTGYGLDGTVWGGEFLLVTNDTFHRAAWFQPFRLPGGDKAVKEPRRSALGLLFACFGEAAFEMDSLAPVRTFSRAELAALKTMLRRGVHSPLTSSAGRLFDAVASLIGLRQQVRFEGQAAMELEFAAERSRTDAVYPIRLCEAASVINSSLEFGSPVPPHPGPLPEGEGRGEGEPTQLYAAALSASGTRPQQSPHHPAATMPPSPAPLVLDYAPMIEGLIADVKQGLDTGAIAATFHNSLVEAMVLVARRVGEPKVALTGGCFQNRRLTEQAVLGLRRAGFRPYWHQRIPPNDGGIALGQIMAAARAKR